MGLFTDLAGLGAVAAAPLTGGGSLALTPLIAGAAAGVGKHFLIDKPQEDADRHAAAETQRYSPWTHIQAQPVAHSSLLGGALQGAAIGNMVGGALGAAPVMGGVAGGAGDAGATSPWMQFTSPQMNQMNQISGRKFGMA